MTKAVAETRRLLTHENPVMKWVAIVHNKIVHIYPTV